MMMKSQPKVTDYLPSSSGRKLSLRSSVRGRKIRQPESDRVSTWLIIGMIVFVAVAVLRLSTLQIKYGTFYREQAMRNQLRQDYTYAPRGVIKDINGKILVDNKLLTQVSVVPYLWQRSQSNCSQALGGIAKIINQSSQSITTLIKKYENELEPQLLTRSINREQSIALSQLQSNCNALVLSPISSRKYITDRGLSQVLGYVGQPSTKELESTPNLLPSDLIGRSGIEAYYDKYLRGVDGINRMQVDALGRVVQTMSSVPAKQGKDIQLNIDDKLQTTLYRQLVSGLQKSGAKRGAAVALNPKTGAVLSMVNVPDYNNNDFVRGMTNSEYDKLLNDLNRPLVDSAVSGNFPAGSVVKPVIAAAALQEGVITPSTRVYDGGFIDVKNIYNPNIVYRYHGWDHSGLGSVDAVSAIALSSDIFFYAIGGGYGDQSGLGASRIARYYSDFGLGQATGIDLPIDSTGYVPKPRNGKNLLGSAWTVGDTYNISIGQGDLQVSPLQMVLAETAVINGGNLLRPQIVHSIDGELISRPSIRRRVSVDEANLAVSRLGMEAAIKSFRAGVFDGIPVEVAGKTGTAETTDNEKPHSWFIGYAPANNPKIVIAVFVDRGGEGSQVAAPIAAAGLKSYLTNK